MRKGLVWLVMLMLSILVLNSGSWAGVMWKERISKPHPKRISLTEVAKDLKTTQQDMEGLKQTVQDLQTKIVSNELVNRQLIAEERISILEKKVGALAGWVTLLGSVTAILVVLFIGLLFAVMMLVGKKRVA